MLRYYFLQARLFTFTKVKIQNCSQQHLSGSNRPLKLHPYLQCEDLQVRAQIHHGAIYIFGEKPAQGIIVVNQNEEIKVLYTGFADQPDLGVSDVPLGDI